MMIGFNALRSALTVYRKLPSLVPSISRNFAVSLPAEIYCNPEYYEIERKNFLGPSWQAITHESALIDDESNASAVYMAETIAGYPCILTRNTNTGEIAGFLNICRHRGGPLEWDGTKGACKLNGFSCKYHGWTYNLKGNLKGMPLFGDQTDVDKSKLSLWPIRVAKWRGIVFAQIIPPTVSINDSDQNVAMSGPEADDLFKSDQAAFCSRMEGIPLESYVYHSSVTHAMNCNWKVYMENYLEGYHIPFMHPELNKQVNMKLIKIV